jgi:hypothetical protein
MNEECEVGGQGGVGVPASCISNLENIAEKCS